MADILIHGTSMPRERDHLTITINADGTVQPLVDMYCPIIAHAIELPPHGDLIEAEHLKETLDYYIREAGWGDEINMALRWVKDEFIESEPVIAPSNNEDADG